MSDRPSRLPFLAAGALAATADLLTKWWVFRAVPYRSHRPVVEGWLEFYPTHNPAGPWSWGHRSSDVLRFALPMLSVVAVALILRFLRQTDPRDRVRSLGLALILGGAAGNLWDRAATALDASYGWARPWEWSWGRDFPAFNLADAWITVGVALVAWRILYEWRPAEPPATAPAAGAAGEPDEVRA